MSSIPVHISDLRVSLDQFQADKPVGVDHHLKPWIAEMLGCEKNDVLSYDISRRSLDARKKPALQFVYNLTAEIDDQAHIRDADCITLNPDQPDQNQSLYKLQKKDDAPSQAIVVGTGPAGIMAAYLLALHGCKPLIIDRGFDVEQRGTDLATFHRTRELHQDSNYLYGEGGAGTYSDGKLYTRVKDWRMQFLLEAFVAARAPKHILYRHHPHIGSDILPHMAKRLRQQIEEWGGSFRWGSTVTDIIEREGACAGVILENGERIEADVTLIAPGHSARDLITTLVKRNIDCKAKGFQLGCRVEHPQHIINKAQYGCQPPRYLLGAAEYNLVSRPKNSAPNTTTFCMCPGGEILAATSDPGQLSTNGMSCFARSSPFANAGLIINQPINRDSNGLEGFEYIADIERRAFAAGGHNYSCPGQSAVNFLRGEEAPVQESSYKLGVIPGRLDKILPNDTVDGLRAALKFYERIIPGFLKQGQLVGVETRVSSPVRFERNPESLASSLPNLYLAGEGAGYAGGIVSAGLDGLRLAETILTGKIAKRSRK